MIRLQLRGVFNPFYSFFLAFVSRFAYKPLYSSQNHSLNCRQDRQSVTFTREAGGRAGTRHTQERKGDPKGALNTVKPDPHSTARHTDHSEGPERQTERRGRKEEGDRDEVGAVSTLLVWSPRPFGVAPWRLERKS